MDALEHNGSRSFFQPGGTDHVQHHVFFHEGEDALIAKLCRFVADALRPQHGAVVVATAEHLSALRAQARGLGIDLEMAEAHGQFVALDARELLDRLLVENKPSRTRFRIVMPGLLRMIATEYPCLHIYGEMVALLWEEGNIEGTLRLEQLWNELAQEHSFELLCGYPRQGFASPAHAEHHELICKAHARVVEVN